MDSMIDDVERQLQSSPTISEVETDEDYFEDVEEIDPAQELDKASALLKETAVLFEFLSNPNFCKAISKRERLIMDKIVDRIYDLTDELDKDVEALESEE